MTDTTNLRRKLFSTSSKATEQVASTLSIRSRFQRVAAFCSPLFEIARVLVCFDHVARIIVNANDGIMRAAVERCAVGLLAHSIGFR